MLIYKKTERVYMKKIILALCLVLLGTPVLASSMKPVLNDNQVIYSPSTKTWHKDGVFKDGIALTKKTSPGTGNYSIYYNMDNEIMLGSNYEFLYDGRLISCHNADLKIFELVYNGKFFEEKELTEDQIKEIFPDAEIIKISQFTDQKVTVKKPAFEKKKFLLLNDTDEYFYKYSFKPKSVKYSPVAGLFKASSIGRITFSHFGQDKYTIYVKNTFKK